MFTYAMNNCDAVSLESIFTVAISVATQHYANF